MQPTRQDVVECYRRILGREPESDAVVDRRLAMGQDLWSLLGDFIRSDEHSAKVAVLSRHSMMKASRAHYLAHGLTEACRFSCLFYNYAFLQSRMEIRSLITLMKDGLTILEGAPAVPSLAVTMRMFAGPTDEGENSLVVTLDGSDLAILTFSIVPPKEFGLSGETAFLVSRVQGFVDAGRRVADLTKQLGAVSPPYLLIACLEGIAKASGVQTIVGVSARMQPSYRDAYDALFTRSYDEFFLSLGATRLDSGFHVLTLPRRHRPLEQIIAGHRARTRSKRAIKQAFSDRAGTAWSSHLRRSPGEPQARAHLPVRPVRYLRLPARLRMIGGRVVRNFARWYVAADG